MRLGQLAAATSALMMIAAPAAAASKLSIGSIESVRADSEIEGSKFAPVIGILGAVFIILGAGLAFDVIDSGNKDAESA